MGAALAKNFPRLNQAVANLPKVTAGWNDVPGIAGLTRFDGKKVGTVTGVRDYFGADVVPVVENNATRFQHLDTWVPRTDAIPILLVVVGGIVILWGLWFLFRSLKGRLHIGESMFGWFIVTAVGLIVIGVVIGFRLLPALDGGQKMVEDLRPVFADSRIAAHTPAITMVSTVVDLLDPITTEKGGAAADVPKLIAFVSEQTGLTQAQVVGALAKNVPKTTGLLTALPLSAVSTELPKLREFLATTLQITPAEVDTALKQNFPHLAQSIASLPTLTKAWDALPGAPGFVRFDGTPITNVTGVRDYFGGDVIPMLAAQKGNFQSLDTNVPLNVFAPLLMVIAIVVILLGTLMFMRHESGEEASALAASKPAVT